MRHKIVVSRDLGPDIMPILLGRGDVEVVVWPENRPCDRTWLLQNVPGAAGLLVMFTEKIDVPLLDVAGDTLRVVSTMSVGYEHVDLSAIAQRGIKLGYTPDVLTDAVADLSVMLALMAGRDVRQAMSVVHSSQWPAFTWSPFAFCGQQLSATTVSPTKTVGFLGFGRISQATLSRLIPFGFTHCIYSSNPSSPLNLARDEALSKKHNLKSLRRVDLDELARESDVLFVLAPGGASTHHLVNETFLEKMKKTSVLVNSSRGTLVDSNALAKALRDGQIWAAGVDVVEGEPNITTDHPLVKEPRCCILPHIGSATVETRLGMATLAAKNVLAGVYGEALPAGLDIV